MSYYPPYNKTQVDSSFVLTKLKELSTIEKFNLTAKSNTWVAYGDSYVATSASWISFVEIIAQETGTTLIRRGYGGASIDNLLVREADSNNVLSNPDYANYSSLINYGLNDYRVDPSVKAFFGNYYQYHKCCLGTYLFLSIPQNKLIRIQDLTPGIGNAWSGTGGIMGMSTQQLNDSVGTTVSGRYITFGFWVTGNGDGKHEWEIKVNGEVVSTVKITYDAALSAFYMYGVLIDTGSKSEKLVECKNISVDEVATPHYIAYAASFNGDEIDTKNVLINTPVTCDLKTRAETGTFNGDLSARKDIIRAMKDAVIACRSTGLPVFLNEVEVGLSLFRSDNLHLTSYGHKILGKEILKNIII